MAKSARVLRATKPTFTSQSTHSSNGPLSVQINALN